MVFETFKMDGNYLEYLEECAKVLSTIFFLNKNWIHSKKKNYD